MATYIPTSWGRTRRPKHLHNDNPVPEFQGKTTGTSVAIVTNPANFSDALTSTTEGPITMLLESGLRFFCL